MLSLNHLVRSLVLLLGVVLTAGCSAAGNAGLPDQWEPDNAGQLTAAEADEEMF